MVFLYCAMCLLMVGYNKITYKRLFNPLNIYLMIWGSMVCLYEVKLIEYYDLSYTTWFVIFCATILVFFGYRFGFSIKCNAALSNEYIDNVKLKQSILRTSLLSAVAIVPNTFFLIKRYGFNLLSKTSQIYVDNLSDNPPFSIPYLGALSMVSCVLASIYYIKYGFEKMLIIPIILAILCNLPSGSRGVLILTIVFLVNPLFVVKREPRKENLQKKRSKKDKIRLFLLIMLVVVMFIILTFSRAKNMDSYFYQFMSPGMLVIAGKIAAVYKIYEYYTSPIGVLNAFVSNPEYSFGGNTFGVLYGFLNKFGFNIPYSRYQTFYDVPIRTNVGTWLRELMQDFTLPGMFVTVFLFAILVGYFESKALKYNRREDILLCSVLGTILIMGFFVWYLREGTMVVVLLTCFVDRFLSKMRVNTRGRFTMMDAT